MIFSYAMFNINKEKSVEMISQKFNAYYYFYFYFWRSSAGEGFA